MFETSVRPRWRTLLTAGAMTGVLVTAIGTTTHAEFVDVDYLPATLSGHGSETASTAGGDLDGDGIDDLVFWGGSRVLWGNGDGQVHTRACIFDEGGCLPEPSSTSVASEGAACGRGIDLFDVDNDGRLDIVCTGDGTVDVIHNVGGRQFGDIVRAIDGMDGAKRPTFADLDGDGDLDLVKASGRFFSPSTTGVYVALNDGGVFGPATLVSDLLAWGSLFTSDVDGDGDPDVIMLGSPAMSTALSLTVLPGDGDGSFDAPIQLPVDAAIPNELVLGDTNTMVVGDWNGDGHDDVAWSSSTGVQVLLHDGEGISGTPVEVPVASGPLAVGDWDGDGSPDLAVNGSTALINDGNGTFAASPWSGSWPYFRAVLDLDGDGDDEIAVPRYYTGVEIDAVQVYEFDHVAPVVSVWAQPESPSGTGWYNASQAPAGFAARATDDLRLKSITCTDASGAVLSEQNLGSGDALWGYLDAGAALTDGTHRITCIATDAERTSAPASISVAVDRTPPTLSGSVSPNPAPQGAVAIATATATDATSGIAGSTCDTPDTSTAGDMTVWCHATDHAGNRTDQQVAYTVEPAVVADPTMTLTVDAADTVGTTGWYNRDSSGTDGVIVHATATDAVGFTCRDGDEVIVDTVGTFADMSLGDGLHTLTCIPEDAGGTGEPLVLTLMVDQAPPTLAPSVTPDPALLGDIAVASPDAADATSGVASSSCDQPDTSTVGTWNITCAATDGAGNTTTATVDYTVQYGFGGLQQPAQRDSYRAGSTIPLKFTLIDHAGVALTGAAAQAIADECLARVRLDGVLQPGCVGYDPDGERFRYNLHTPSDATGAHVVGIEVIASDRTTLVAPVTAELTLR